MMKNIVKLLGLYWAENKKILLFYSLGLFLYNMVLYGVFYEGRIRYDFFLFGMFFLMVQSKTLIVSSTNYNHILLSVKPIEKWIVSVFVYVFVAFIIIFSMTVLGQVMGRYLVYWIKSDVNALNFVYKKESIVLETCFFVLVQAVFLFLFVTKTFATPFSKMTKRNKIILFVYFLSLVLIVMFIPTIARSKEITGATALLLGVILWIANYFEIKKQELK